MSALIRDTQNTRSDDVSSGDSAAQGPAPEVEMQNALGNQEVLNQVEGLTGRTFNRILGASESDQTTADQSFGQAELEAYLKDRLQFAEGEWFSGTKITGAAKSIIEDLDQNGDSRVDWAEFQVFRSRMLEAMAPGISEEASAAEIENAAAASFESFGENGSDFTSLEAHNHSHIAPDTEHRDLIAQLGALLLLDSADIDEQTLAPRDRSLTEGEWMDAAREFATDKTSG